ncbi:hypothetical protein [Flagellimonas sp.]|uniref:hypothetical protein n=1 Tax=Flagellimonas sp. TaxID=2058762 RepID=UPI003B5C003A
MKQIPLLFLLMLLFSCEEDEIDDFREAQFSAVFLNSGTNVCNGAGLTFNFVITYPDERQESFDLAPTMESRKSLGLVRDNESINVKVFFPSSEDPIAEANIPFIFNGISDEQLEPPGNELMIVYCHSETNGIQWDTFY